MSASIAGSIGGCRCTSPNITGRRCGMGFLKGFSDPFKKSNIAKKNSSFPYIPYPWFNIYINQGFFMVFLNNECSLVDFHYIYIYIYPPGN